MKIYKIYMLTLLYLCYIIIIVNGTLSPSNKGKKSKSKEFKVKNGPQPDSVFDRDLIEEEPVGKDILSENGAYYKDTTFRYFNGTILGYVTPWNNHGYDVAKLWSQKFDIISPVWIQILRRSASEYEVRGTHDVDNGWLNDVKKAGKYKNKIMPRVMFDQFSDSDYSKLLTYPSEQNIVIQLIVDVCQKYKLDGIVLEVWSQLAARVDDDHLIKLVTGISLALRQTLKDLILVIPPQRKETYDLFSAKHFKILYPHVLGFSLMTYDYSSIQRPGANAPIYWMRNAVQHICPDTLDNYAEKRKKILLGFNLFGMDYTPEGGGPIISHEYLSLVKYVKGRLQLDERDDENFFEVKTPNGRHYVFYPTLYSIHQRIKLAIDLGTGISMWEIGQGLDYFYDLF